MLSVAHCIILNPLGLNVGRQKGNEVKDRIITASIVNDLTTTFIASRGSIVGISIFSLIADSLADIDDAKYYKKSEVDKCIEDIDSLGTVLKYGLGTAGFVLTPILSCEDLKTDGILLGDPFPSI